MNTRANILFAMTVATLLLAGPVLRAENMTSNSLAKAVSELQSARAVCESAQVAQTFAEGAVEHHKTLLVAGDAAATRNLEIARARKKAADNQLIEARATLAAAEETERQARRAAKVTARDASHSMSK